MGGVHGLKSGPPPFGAVCAAAAAGAAWAAEAAAGLGWAEGAEAVAAWACLAGEAAGVDP